MVSWNEKVEVEKTSHNSNLYCTRFSPLIIYTYFLCIQKRLPLKRLILKAASSNLHVYKIKEHNSRSQPEIDKKAEASIFHMDLLKW